MRARFACAEIVAVVILLWIGHRPLRFCAWQSIRSNPLTCTFASGLATIFQTHRVRHLHARRTEATQVLFGRHGRIRVFAGEAHGNPYDILGLPRGAREPEIRPAFKTLAATLHPDVVDTGNENAFRRALWAYKELSDPVRRKRWSRRRRPRVESFEDLLDIEDAVSYSTKAERSDANFADEWDEILKQSERRQLKDLAKQDWFAWEQWEKTNGDMQRLQRIVEEFLNDDSQVRRLLDGTYEARGTNHRKTRYFKRNVEGGRNIVVYFWDQRDGEDCSGWWVGPEVGGDTVFAFSSMRGPRPPASDWRVPVGGPVSDSFRITFSEDGQTLSMFFDSGER